MRSSGSWRALASRRLSSRHDGRTDPSTVRERASPGARFSCRVRALPSVRRLSHLAARRCEQHDEEQNDEVRWRGAESNCRHRDFQSRALPTELPRLGSRQWGHLRPAVSQNSNRRRGPAPPRCRRERTDSRSRRRSLLRPSLLLASWAVRPSGAARLARLPVKEEVAGSSPVWGAILTSCSDSGVEGVQHHAGRGGPKLGTSDQRSGGADQLGAASASAVWVSCFRPLPSAFTR